MCEKLARGLAYVGFFLMPAFSLLRVYRNLSVSDVLIGGAFLLLLASQPRRALFAILRNPLNLPVAIFLVGFLATFVISEVGAEQTMESLFSLTQLLFCIYAMTTVLFLCNVDAALAAIATSTAVLGVAAVLFLSGILGVGAFLHLWGRLSIRGLEPNQAARVFFVGVVIMCFRWKKLRSWIFSGATVTCWLATVSRSGLLAFGSLVIPLFRRRPLFSLVAIGGACCCALLLSVGGTFSPLAGYTQGIAGAVQLADYSTIDRLHQYRDGVEMMAQSPLVGRGMGVYPQGVAAVHNVFLGMQVEIGLLGLLSFLLMYVIVFRIARGLESGFGMLNVLLVGTVLFDFFMAPTQNRLFWLPFSLVLALYLQRLAGPGHRPPSTHASTSTTR